MSSFKTVITFRKKKNNLHYCHDLGTLYDPICLVAYLCKGIICNNKFTEYPYKSYHLKISCSKYGIYLLQIQYLFYNPWKENRFGGVEVEEKFHNLGYIKTEESATCMVCEMILCANLYINTNFVVFCSSCLNFRYNYPSLTFNHLKMIHRILNGNEN